MSTLEDSHDSPPDPQPYRQIERFLRTITPSDHVGSFSTIPEIIDSLHDSILYFFLTTRVPQGSTTYTPASESRRAHGSSEAALSLPSLFSAIEQGTISSRRQAPRHTTLSERQTLQIAALRFHDEVIRMLRMSLTQIQHSKLDLEDMLSMTTSLATLEQRYGARENADMHFKACRQIVKLIGDPWTITQEKSILWYEFILAAKDHSFIWDFSGVAERAEQLTQILQEISRTWKKAELRQETQAFVRSTNISVSPFLENGTLLYDILSYPGDFQSAEERGPSESVAQLACVLLYSKTILDLSHTPHTIFMYKKRLEKVLQEQQSEGSGNVASLLYRMCGDVGVLDADRPFRRWQVAAMINASKLLHSTWQARLTQWLFLFISGEAYKDELKLNSFAFSYAAAISDQEASRPHTTTGSSSLPNRPRRPRREYSESPASSRSERSSGPPIDPAILSSGSGSRRGGSAAFTPPETD